MSEKNENESLEVTEEDGVERSRSVSWSHKACLCQNCMKLFPLKIETPCKERSCPKCGAKMVGI